MSSAVRSGGGPEDSYTCRIHVGILSDHLLDHDQVIFERSAQISIRELVECSRAPRGAATVDHHYDEAELRDRLQAPHRRAKSLRNKECLGTRIEIGRASCRERV